MLFPFPKLNENRPGWLIGTTVVGSCFIYESWWFSPACLLGPVIHEWTRQPEPAIVEVHWEQWILRINFFRVRLLFPTPIKSISLSCSLSTMTFPFLSLIVWSTIICPLLDKWSEYYDRATLWYTVVYYVVVGGNDLHTGSQILACFLSTCRVSLLAQWTKAERTVGLLSRRVMQSKVQRVNETVYLAELKNAAELNYVLALAESGHFLTHWLNCIVLVLTWGMPTRLIGSNDENHATSCHSCNC